MKFGIRKRGRDMKQCEAFKKNGERCGYDAILKGLCVSHLYQKRKKQEEMKKNEL